MSVATLVKKLVDNNGALETSILANSLAWDSAGLSDNLDTNILIEVRTLDSVELSASI
jgi:hypothetical protein